MREPSSGRVFPHVEVADAPLDEVLLGDLQVSEQLPERLLVLLRVLVVDDLELDRGAEPLDVLEVD